MIGLRQLLEVPEPCRLSDEDVDLLALARHPDPSRLLGPKFIHGHVVLRCWVSGAESVSVVSDLFLPPELTDEKRDPPSEVLLQQVAQCPKECPWLFETAFLLEGEKCGEQFARKWKYEMRIVYSGGAKSSLPDPYSLGPLLPEAFLSSWATGNTEVSPASMFGAHHMELCGIRPGLWGTRFAVWAPHARAVSVVGDFNFWDGRAHPMCQRSSFGVWELFLPVWDLRGQKYGYQILTCKAETIIKADPFAQEFVDPSNGDHDAKIPLHDDYSRSAWNGTFAWRDSTWIHNRARTFGQTNWASQPLSIYEVHLGSWAGLQEGKRTYRALAEPLAKHIKELGFTAVEFLPLTQYSCEQSWGYQCAAGLYAVDSRLGTPDDFRHLVDTLHQHSIAVFIDFVGAHFAKDEWGLTCYSGAAQFEYDGQLGELPGWGTARFDYSKPEVKAYILGAAQHWIEHFHVDGLRVDAVAAMVYKSFGREEDGDAILAGKGVVNEDGVKLLRDLCNLVRSRHPGVLLSAEESTNFKWVTTRPAVHGTERHTVQVQDLGFHLKWNMGFSYDTLAFLGTDFEKRPHLETFGMKKLAWYLAYAFNERWVLPFSHDNSHARSLLDQMIPSGATDIESKFAHLRMLMMYVIGMPGRPLLFMGSEVGEGAWSISKAIDWEHAATDPSKQQLRDWVAKLLQLYQDLPSLHRQDDDAEGFDWIDQDASNRCIYAWRRCARGEADVIIVVNASIDDVKGYQVAIKPNSSRRWRCAAATSMAHEVDATNSSERMVEIMLGADHFLTDLPPCAAQLWLVHDGSLVNKSALCTNGYLAGDALPCQVPADKVRVNFEIKHGGASNGDMLRVVGGCKELGNWQPNAGLRLEPSVDASQIWQGSVDFTPGSLPAEFKFITIKSDGTVCWEPFEGNRLVNATSKDIRINAEFGHA